MAKDPPPADPPEDIPAWFMTYSDVITLLMTFFILLLTFATTEPERFEKITVSFFGESGATGIAGHEHDKIDRDSWLQRVRPRAARIATEGSEMPPNVDEPAAKAVGRGLEAASEEEAQQDVMKTHAFKMNLSELVNSNMQLTERGKRVAAKLSKQLRKLPVHCAIEISHQALASRAVAFANYLYRAEGVRPGQVAVGMVDNMNQDQVRFAIERYEM